MSIRIEDAPSPNSDARGRGVDMVVLHYTGMQTGAEALDRLRDPAAKVSAHYLVEEDGRVFRLVAEENRAWHAGVASWRGESDINARSVGIEIVNPGHEWGYRPFPEEQVAAVIDLVAGVVARHGVKPARVVGHSDVAPERKEDPGELFPWDRLAEKSLAIGTYRGAPDPSVDYFDALKAIADIGYDAPDRAHAAAVLAFQRRFCPAALGQGLSPLTKAAAIWAAGEAS
ncbi:MAG: N-acetylmuramoyl-L-alanine amidase [Pseudomonadota bacterium]